MDIFFDTDEYVTRKTELVIFLRPVVVNDPNINTDLEGYVRLLSQVDGSFVGRVKADGDGVRADMLSDGNVLYVFGNSGDLVSHLGISGDAKGLVSTDLNQDAW